MACGGSTALTTASLAKAVCMQAETGGVDVCWHLRGACAALRWAVASDRDHIWCTPSAPARKPPQPQRDRRTKCVSGCAAIRRPVAVMKDGHVGGARKPFDIRPPNPKSQVQVDKAANEQESSAPTQNMDANQAIYVNFWSAPLRPHPS